MALVKALRPADARMSLIGGAGHWVAYEAPAPFEATLADRLA